MKLGTSNKDKRSGAMKEAPKMGGFTLVELLVSIGIFTMITTVAVFNNNRFNSSVLLTNLAYEIGLSIRQAQFYGITVKQSSTLDRFDSGYGVHFDISTPTTYKIFEDKNTCTFPNICTNHIYDAADGDVETFRIRKGNLISRVCIDGTCVANADITFVRPNPDAYIRALSGSTDASKAEICVISPQNLVRKIVVESTGQISVVADDTGICTS